MKKYILTPIFAALVSVLLVGCKDKAESEQLVSTKNMIKNIAFKDLAGKNINMVYTGEGFKFEGEGEKSTLLVFFATWCPPCKAEIPHLIELKNKYSDKFNVISVLLEENKSPAEVSSFIKEHKINYFVSTEESANFEAAKIFGVKGFPTMFLFDKDGKKIAFYPGATPAEIIEQDILKTVGK